MTVVIRRCCVRYYERLQQLLLPDGRLHHVQWCNALRHSMHTTPPTANIQRRSNSDERRLATDVAFRKSTAAELILMNDFNSIKALVHLSSSASFCSSSPPPLATTTHGRGKGH